MKITIHKSLENGVCVNRIMTSDWSVDDSASMQDFGEPVINVGGLFSDGMKALATGSVDLSGGYDFSVHTPYFDIVVNGAPSVQVMLISACANLTAVVAHLNDRLVAAGLASKMMAVADGTGKYVVLETYCAGASQTFTVAAGSTDALSILGISANTYNGSGNNDFTLPNALYGISSGSPFVQKFDSRDGGLPLAETNSGMWTAQVVVTLKAAITAMREQSDTFTTESMETY